VVLNQLGKETLNVCAISEALRADEAESSHLPL